jgi:hypothetical protein
MTQMQPQGLHSGHHCYTRKCDTVEDGLMESASEGSPDG